MVLENHLPAFIDFMNECELRSLAQHLLEIMGEQQNNIAANHLTQKLGLTLFFPIVNNGSCI